MGKSSENILVTGSAGFIGFHLSLQLLKKGFSVIGIDCLNEYYDIDLKLYRNKILKSYKDYFFFKVNLENFQKTKKILENYKPAYIFHLAAQAGVRYSIEAPREYLNSNINSTFNLLEILKTQQPKHLLLASTSSVYGANLNLPFKEKYKADEQMSFYAASKKACEVMAHSFSHIHKIPITTFRFFTVYGPWGRPDMALYKFTKAILNNEVIDVYNHGKMQRDFTYIDDLVYAICSLKELAPKISEYKKLGVSSIAPYRLVNIGNNCAVNLKDFIEVIEKKLNKKAKINYLDLQKGDVPKTLSDTNILDELIGKKRKKTNIYSGVSNFIDWYIDYYHKENKC